MEIIKIIKRKRNEINAAPPTPIALETLVIFEENRRFLLYDSGQNQERILMFGRQYNMRLFGDSTILFEGGTFNMSPILFTQLYTISALKRGGSHPIVYALLPDKGGANI